MGREEEISVLKGMSDYNELIIALQDPGIVDVKDEKQQMTYPVLRKFTVKTIKVWLEEDFQPSNLPQNISKYGN